MLKREGVFSTKIGGAGAVFFFLLSAGNAGSC